jgi:hypothetical protein
MKWLLLLLLVLCSCNNERQPPSPEAGLMLDSLQVVEVMRGNGIIPFNGFAIADSAYELPSEEWFKNKFPAILGDFFKDLKQTRWVAESNDCDDFSKMAAAFAHLIHNNTPAHLKGTSLAVGEFYYKINGDNSQGHAINFAIVKTKEGKAKVVFMDPQTLSVVQLSEREVQSCDNWLL